MASRLVTAILAIDGVDGVVTGFRRVGEAAVEYGQVAQKAGARAGAWIDKHNRQLERVGGSLVTMGAVGVAAVGGLIKAAIDWESAWAGVTKTVDGTPEQMEALNRGLRDMAKELPATHAEIAGVAEAAGQLGVRTEDVEGFTRTMIDLGETTNLSSEEAATSLQQMMNVMGTAGADVDRLGSAVVALGNNGASTEADIVAMSKRIAAAGSQIGMTEADVLGFAGALSSVGIEAEAGGTAVSLTFKQLDADVREGGEQLELIAETAGKTSEEFAAAWRDDAGSAVADFVEGLGEMQASGEDINGVLAELDMRGIRQTDSLLRLANATKNAGGEQDLLREQLELAAEAWEQNTALADEAAQRYNTRASQARVALNEVKDELITLGESMLPVFDTIISTVSDMAQAISGIPQPVKDTATAVLLVSSAGALAAGGVLKLVTAAANLRGGLQKLGISMRAFSLTTGVIGVALLAAGAALAAWMNQQAEARAKADAYTAAIKEQGEIIGQTTQEMAASALQEAGVLDLAAEYGANLADVTDAALGNADAMDRVRDAISGSSDAIQRQIDLNREEIDALGEKGNLSQEEYEHVSRLIDKNEELSTELANRTSGTEKVISAIEGEQEVVMSAAEKIEQLREATGENTDATEDAAQAALEHEQAEQQRAEAMAASEEATRQALETAQHYGNMLLELSGSEIGVERSIASLSERLDELNKGGEGNARTLDLQTESGRANQDALDSLARSTQSYVETLYDQGASTEEITAETQRAREEWINAAEAMGMGAEEATKLADAYFAVPERIETEFATPGMHLSQEEADILNEKLRAIPTSIRSEIVAIADKEGLAAAEAAIDRAARNRTLTIYASTVGLPGPVAGAIRAANRADGAVVDYYASGGLRENHVAQIARAGDWRVWAEPETGGEAYIPLAQSKRSRSLQIWHETGRRLGVQGYADGAIRARHREPAPQVAGGNFSFTVNGADPAAVGQFLMSRVEHQFEDMGVRRR